MSRKRPDPDRTSPPDLPEGRGEWAIPPDDYYDMFMPDDVEEVLKMHVPYMGAGSAYARIEEVCASVQGLINMVPTYLPLEGAFPQGPQLDGAGRRFLVDECFRRINLPAGEWVALCTVLPPSAATALQTLARTIDGIWRRWERAETEFGLLVERARLAKKQGERLPDEVSVPLRTIQEQDLTWLKQALVIVLGAVAAEHSRKKRITGPEQKRKVTDEDEARGKWIYDKLYNIKIPQKTVLDEYKRVAKANGWGPISSVNGLKDRAADYADRHHLPRPPRRHGK
jgi:hypothetical protein